MQDIIKIDGLSISKPSAERIRQEVAWKIEEGILDPIKVMASIKFYEKVFQGDDKKNNGLTHLIKEKVITEIERDKARTEYYGFVVQVKEAGVNYDYSRCNDTELEELLEEEAKIKAKIKLRQDFLKSIKDHLDVIQDGEAKTIYPPAKFSTTSPSFTLK